MKRLSILGAAVLAALFAVESLAWDFLYSTPLGGRWVRSDNPLQVEEYDHRSEARLSALVEELGENQWRLYTVWNRTEYTCVDGSVAFPDGYDRTVYSPKTNALALAAHKADTANPHSVTSRQADEAGGTANGAGAVLAMYGVGADKTNGVSLLDGYGDAIDSKYDRWVHAGDRDFWLIATNATWDFRTLGRPMWFGVGLATTGEVAEVESTAAEALSTASTHAGNTNNPHNVTAAQIGALTAEEDPVWTEEKTEVWEAIGSLSNEVGSVLSAEADPVWVAASNAVLTDIANLRMDVDALSGGASNSISTVASNLAAHVAATDNPHQVTAAQVGALPTDWTNAAAALNVTGALTLGGEARTNWPGTNTFTEAYPYNGRWVVDDPVGFESDVTFIENVEANTIHAEDIVMNGGSGNISVTNGATLTLGETADEVQAIKSWQDLGGLFLPLMNLDANTVLSGGLTIRNSGSRSAPPIDVAFQRANLLLNGDSISSWGDITENVEGDIEDLQAALSMHENDHANPHRVTAAQVGALSATAGGTISQGQKIYFANGSNYVGTTDGGAFMLVGAGPIIRDSADGSSIYRDDGLWAFDDGIWAPVGEFGDSLTVGTNTVENIGLLNDSAAVYAHMAATNNPHAVTLAQLDANDEGEALLDKYGIDVYSADGVSTLRGFGHYLGFEENLWELTGDFTVSSDDGTIDFSTDGIPTYHGTNLATMTDLSVATADLASYTWVRSQIASSVAGQYTSLQQFGNHTNDANAHGLGAIRDAIADMATEDYVADRIGDLISDYGMDDMMTSNQIAQSFMLREEFTDATNALWGAFAGMATDADISAATNGLATASSVTALDGRVTVLESAAFGPDGVDVSSLANDLVDVEDRVSVAESDIADLQDIAGAAWPTNPAADERVVFPKVSYYQNENDRTVIDPGFYDQGIAPHRSGAISNLALLAATKVEAGKMFVHGDPVLASTQFSSNYIAGNSIISMPRTFTATNDTLWCHYNYPDYIGKLHFVWSNAWYTEVVTNYTVVTNGGTVTTNETTATVTNHYQPTVSLTITATNAANEEVSFNVIPRMDGQDQEVYIDRTPLYLIKGFYISPNPYPIPSPATDPVLIGFWYEKPASFGEQYDLYGKVLMVDEPDDARGVANKAYVDGIVGGVDLHAIYNRDATTYLNGNEVVFNPRYALTFSNNDMTIGYGGFPVMTFKGGMKVVPVMTALTPKGNTVYAYCTGTADASLRMEWCTNTAAMVDGGVVFEDVPAARITAQYMVDEYTWCTEIDGSGISACWMRAWLTSLSHGLTDVELVTEDGAQSFAALFAKVAELHAATNLYAMAADLAAHEARQDNPHHVTAAQIGALTSESDTAALAALAAASNHFAGAIADIGENLPGLDAFEERLAALEAWRRSARDAMALTNLAPGANLRWMALTNLGEYVWRDVAMDENATNTVFAGNNTPIWEETKSGTKLKWESNANMPVTRWKSVAVSANGAKAVALPVEGYPYIRTQAGISRYVQDTNHDLYWNTAAVSWDGSRVVAVDDFSEWTVNTSNGKWAGTTNPVADGYRYLTYESAFAGSSGDILLSDDSSLAFGALRRFALVRADGSVVDGRIVLPDGIDAEATVATRTPYNAPASEYIRAGKDSWPANLQQDGSYRPTAGTTNTHVTKLVGGPWVDVVRDGTVPHPLYVRTVAQWVETNRWNEGHYERWQNNYQYMDGVVRTNTNGDIWLYGTPVFGDEEFEDVIQTQVVTTNMFRVNQGTWATSYAYVGENKEWVTYTNYLVRMETGTPAQFAVTNQAYTVTNRFAETYEPITGAGLRHWQDVAVSKDAAMRRMWAVEADGKVWRMTGHSWQDGTWTAQDGEGAPGTNLWKQVVCSSGGEQAIVVGDCMVPTGAEASDGTAVTANAWYFDGDYWYALWYALQWPDGHVECVKWRKAFLSKDGYTAYLLPEGVGYVYKLTYQ